MNHNRGHKRIKVNQVMEAMMEWQAGGVGSTIKGSGITG